MPTIPIGTRHELEAHVAMIMLQSPFPPLPIVMLNGEGEQKTGSGHDLLSQALSVSLLSPAPSPKIKEELLAKKQHILMELNTKVSNMWKLEIAKFMQETMHMDTPVIAPKDQTDTPNIYNYIWKRVWRQIPIQKCYDIYCTEFRKYMSCYPGSHDLRIFPLSDVTMDTIVYRHALEHLTARDAYVQDEIFDMEFEEGETKASTKASTLRQVPAVNKDIHTYPDMIRLYAMSMYFESLDSPDVEL